MIDRLFAWAREHNAPVGLDESYLGFEWWMSTRLYLGRGAAIHFGNPDSVTVLRVPPALFKEVRRALVAHGFPPDLYCISSRQDDHMAALAGSCEA